jgi:hypothetical protein
MQKHLNLKIRQCIGAQIQKTILTPDMYNKKFQKKLGVKMY